MTQQEQQTDQTSYEYKRMAGDPYRGVEFDDNLTPTVSMVEGFGIAGRMTVWGSQDEVRRKLGYSKDNRINFRSGTLNDMPQMDASYYNDCGAADPTHFYRESQYLTLVDDALHFQERGNQEMADHLYYSVEGIRSEESGECKGRGGFAGNYLQNLWAGLKKGGLGIATDFAGKAFFPVNQMAERIMITGTGYPGCRGNQGPPVDQKQLLNFAEDLNESRSCGCSK